MISARRSSIILPFAILGVMGGASALFGQAVYVANFGSNNVSAYTITAATGALTGVAGSPFAAGTAAFGVAVDPSGRFVYVTNVGDNTVSPFAANSGVLTTIGAAVATGPTPAGVAVDPLGRFLYVANAGGAGTVSAFTITNGVGALTPVTGSPYAAGGTASGVVVHPTGLYVYVTNAFSGNVSMYKVNPSTGALTPLTPATVVAGAGPNGVAVDPTGRFLYVANGGGTVSGYSINSLTGALTSLGAATSTGGTNPQGLAVDPTGKYLYVANKNSNNVSGFSINSATGALVALAGSPFATGQTGAQSVTVEPTGTYVYVTNQGAGNVAAFSIASGVLTLTASSPVTAGTNPTGIATRTLAPAAQFTITPPATATAGVAFAFDVKAVDRLGNPVLSYNGTVHFTSSDAQAVLPADAALTNGSGSFSATLKTAGTQTITTTDIAIGLIVGSSSGTAVSAAAAVTRLAVVAPPSVKAGTVFSFSVAAQDAFGNTVSGYGGTVHFTSTDGGAVLPADSTLTNGAGTFAATLAHPISQLIIATDSVTAAIFGLSGPITVIVPPGIGKSYSTNPLPLGGTTALNYTVTNPNSGLALLGIAFSDTLPAGVVVATPLVLTGNCGGTVSTSAGASTVSLTDGTIAALSACTVGVNVMPLAVGTLTSLSGNVTSTNGGTGNGASASLVVTGTAAAPPSVSMAFGSASIANNASTTLTITITNPAANPLLLAGLAFTDTLPAGIVVSTPNGLTSTCGGTVTATTGSGSIALSDGTVAFNSSCTIVVNVTGTAAGNFTNGVSVTSTNGGTSNTAAASITVAGNPGPQNFQQLGVFRGTASRLGLFAFDVNENYNYDIGIDTFRFFGLNGDQPVAGDWFGTGVVSLGVFRCPPAVAGTRGVCQWYIDANNNGKWDGVAGGDAIWNFGLTGDQPIVGDWTGDGISKIGVMRCPAIGQPGVCTWYLDAGSEHTYDPATVVVAQFGLPGDQPVANNWNGTGLNDQIGVFRCPAAGQPGVCTWLVDSTGNATVGATYSYGLTGDIAIVGNWFGTGRKRIGVFRGASGQFILNQTGTNTFTFGVDFTGNFGLAGDQPVVGFWTLP